ncbi:hypothetical protein HMPREF0591_0031 [Mycobacterium parascrofulaceum ATCC BAA-614]|uniref:Uncharacterized protein n=1 Tax=Mycobacterium parascrofulaceum ATCC BAA-614 TaxID=525368 RepID=D5P1I7_9MYCO|nr:hypothetical protein HMPREF0591_0031 [Mycobacterium parascrofulaceum ATCC BAA-614]
MRRGIGNGQAAVIVDAFATYLRYCHIRCYTTTASIVSPRTARDGILEW